MEEEPSSKIQTVIEKIQIRSAVGCRSGRTFLKALNYQFIFSASPPATDARTPWRAILFVAWLLGVCTLVGPESEKLFREPRLILLVVTLAALFLIATYIDMPLLSVFSGQRYITLQ